MTIKSVFVYKHIANSKRDYLRVHYENGRVIGCDPRSMPESVRAFLDGRRPVMYGVDYSHAVTGQYSGEYLLYESW